MEDSIALLIPIFGIFMIIAVVIGPIWISSYFRARDREQLHETLRVAYEKGQPVPPELIESLQKNVPASGSLSTPERDLRRAVVLLCVGVGLAGLGFGLYEGIRPYDDSGAWATAWSVAGAGAIPGLIGLAYLILWLAKRGAPKP